MERTGPQWPIDGRECRLRHCARGCWHLGIVRTRKGSHLCGRAEEPAGRGEPPISHPRQPVRLPDLQHPRSESALLAPRGARLGPPFGAGEEVSIADGRYFRRSTPTGYTARATGRTPTNRRPSRTRLRKSCASSAAPMSPDFDRSRSTARAVRLRCVSPNKGPPWLTPLALAVVFFKTAPPIDPVSLVTSLCRRVAAEDGRAPQFIKRLTPMTLFGKANERSIGQLADQVLPPHFGEGEDKKVWDPLEPSQLHHPGLCVESVCSLRPHGRWHEIPTPAQARSDH